MSGILHTETSWIPSSAEERALVQAELDAILSNHHFRSSKRYPALLQYVVEAAMEGRTCDLKERTLGVEVFGRSPDYDTNADPVVRFSASEVRKRIAQYYHENGNHSRLQIDLPLGSYVPQFLMHDAEAALRQPAPAEIETGTGKPAGFPVRATVLASVLLVLLGGAFAAYSHRKSPASAPDVAAIDLLWGPFIQSTGQVVVVVGTSHPRNIAPESATTSFIDHMTGPYHHVSVATAIALAQLGGILRLHGTAYEIKEDTETSLTDVRSRPTILVGATNNAWTMRLVSPLRFHFVRNGRLAQIQDFQHPESTAWTVDFSKPYASVRSDYALVARFHDTTTESPVMVIAGLGSYGTEAASEFAGSPHYLDQILKSMPAGWDKQNVELVLKSDVIDGKVGPPVLVATTTW